MVVKFQIPKELTPGLGEKSTGVFGFCGTWKAIMKDELKSWSE